MAKEINKALAFVIENRLRRSGRLKRDMCREVFGMTNRAALWRRLSGNAEWTLDEVRALARWFGVSMSRLIEEAEYWCLDKEANTMVGSASQPVGEDKDAQSHARG